MDGEAGVETDGKSVNQITLVRNGEWMEGGQNRILSDTENVACNSGAGDSTEKHVKLSTRLAEPQGIIKKRKST